jgi:DNA-binding beta-propeller fold protein YncE
VNKVTVHSADDKVKIPLRWAMTGVSKITLEFSLPGIKIDPFTKDYTGNQPPLQRDDYSRELSDLTQSGRLLVTCTAYDEKGQLNDLQQSVDLDFPPAVTSYTGEPQSDGSLLLKWTTVGATKVTLNPDLSSDIFGPNGHFPVPKPPPLPLPHNPLYALTAMNDQGEKSDPCVFTTWRFGVVRPAIGVGSTPRGIAVSPDSSHVFVTNINDNNVSIIEVNLSNNLPFRILATPVGTGSWPIGIAVSPDGKYVFVTNYNDDSVTVFGGTPPFQPFPAVHFGTGQDWLAVSPDSRHVFVHPYHSGSLSVIDTANAPLFSVLQGSTLENMFPSLVGMAVSPDGRYAFVIDTIINSLWVLRVEAGANGPYQVASPPVGGLGSGPTGVAVSPDGHYIFVANFGGDSVSVIEVSSGPSFEVLSPPVSAGPRPSALTVSPDGSSLFVTNDNGVLVLVIDKNSHPPVRPLQTLSVPRPWDIAASPDGHFIFVVNSDENTISVIEPIAVSM